MFESKSGVFLIAGLGFFFLAFLASGLVPWVMYANIPEKTVEQMLKDQLENPKRSRNVLLEFRDLRERYPETFRRHYGEPTEDKLAEAIRLGHKVYVGEACWHCHSQFVRPVSNEDKRWGPVSKSWEYQNELQRPVLFGTRRVGPDLSREGGRRSNDWHVVHFFQPRSTSKESVMPEYPWLFEGVEQLESVDDYGRPTKIEGPAAPTKKGMALIMYMQWLGSWLDVYPHYHDADPLPTMGVAP